MKRWMALPLGIAIALGAGWALLSSPQPPSPSPVAPTPRASAKPPELGAEIDDVSRARLEEILRDADEEAAR